MSDSRVPPSNSECNLLLAQKNQIKRTQPKFMRFQQYNEKTVVVEKKLSRRAHWDVAINFWLSTNTNYKAIRWPIEEVLHLRQQCQVSFCVLLLRRTGFGKRANLRRLYRNADLLFSHMQNTFAGEPTES